MIAAAMFTLAACGDLIEIPQVDEPSETDKPLPSDEDFKLEGDIVFSATMADIPGQESRTWTLDDQIAIFDGTSLQASKNTQAGQVAKFAANIAKGTKEVVAFYPYSASIKVEGSVVSASLPTEQTVGVNVAPMIASTTGTVLSFNNLATQLGFVVDLDGVKTVTFEASSAIAGNISIDTKTLAATADSKKVVLSGNFEKGKTYYVTVLPGQIESYSFTLSNGSADIAHKNGTELNLAPGSVQSAGTIIEDVPTYRVSHVWVYGGTGPEYGGGKLYDLLQKEDFFNNEDGRGIGAIKDNYFELRHNGDFFNWAGEDGRNWWMVWSGSHNPVNGKDIDLHELYDLIPRHAAKYTMDAAGKLTLTWSNGTVTSGQLVPAGTYVMPTSNLEVKIETMAIQFAFTGGHDDWNNMYNEFNAVACRPRAMFVELEQMPVDFHTPEASLKIDEDFEYVAPLEPDEKFDFETWPGNWNVRGGNSAPYGIWVLGGTGDDPAFISPIDKSWDWNDNIWKESDNGLVIKVTEKTATTVKGTTNYWAGADGGFWDYIWKGTGEDLSKFYGQLPHGEYEFTLNLETFVITFGNGKSANLLGPGTHTFIHGKTLEVPSGMFAFDFEIGDDSMETATSSRWTDIDRFVYGARNYVMIFEKE